MAALAIIFFTTSVILSVYLHLSNKTIDFLKNELEVSTKAIIHLQMERIGLDLDKELCHTDIPPYFKRGDDCLVSHNTETDTYTVETDSVIAILNREEYEKGFGE